MSAGIWNPTQEQGETYRRVLTWRDEDRVPINLTGWAARLQIRRPMLRHLILGLVDDSAPSRITLGGAAGTIEILIDAETSAEMPAGQWRYDLELVAPGGAVTKLLKGTWTVAGEVTT